MPSFVAADLAHSSGLHPRLPEPISMPLVLAARWPPFAAGLLRLGGRACPLPQLFSLQMLKLIFYLLIRPHVLHRSDVRNLRREDGGRCWLLGSCQLSADLSARNTQLFHHRGWGGSLS